MVDTGSIILVPNMPPAEDQGPLGICSGCAATAVLQQYICHSENIDSRRIPPAKKVSALYMASLAQAGGLIGLESFDPDLPGSGGAALHLALEEYGVSSESDCFPYSKLVGGRGSERADPTIRDLFIDLKACYNKLPEQSSPEFNRSFGDFEKMVQDLYRRAGSTISHDYLQNKFKAAKTYSEFLYDLLFKNSIDQNGDWDIGMGLDIPSHCKLCRYPSADSDQTRVGAEESLETIVRVLRKGYPLVLDGVYLDPTLMMDDRGGYPYHCCVIDGYRIMRNANGRTRSMLKVLNSWGESWQESHDDGWVDAEYLLRCVWDYPQTTGVMKKDQRAATRLTWIERDLSQ